MNTPLDILTAGRALPGALEGSSSGMLPVSEIFTSIQGEGTLTGVVSHFIRLSGCNLRCRWCDTPYASWTPDGTTMSIEAIVAGARASGAGHVVVTGGEPMIFPGLNRLSRELHAAGLHITIETAGTVLPTGWFDADAGVRGVCDLYSISPKLSTSTPLNDARNPSGVWAKRHEERRINLDVLQTLLDACARSRAGAPAYQLKFVVCDERDVEEIRELLGTLTGWSPDRVLLMPEGTGAPTAEAKARVVRACMEHGFRYCTRLHIDLFGNKRGT